MGLRKEEKHEKGRATENMVAEKAKRAYEKGNVKGNFTSKKEQEAKEQTTSITEKTKDYSVQRKQCWKGGKGAAHYLGWPLRKRLQSGGQRREKVVQGTKAVAALWMERWGTQGIRQQK